MWYYLEDRVTRGPAPHEEMLALFLERRLPEATLVWREGMSDWVPAGQAGLLPPDEPPPIPEEVLQAQQAQQAQRGPQVATATMSAKQLAGALAWRRFLARQLDFFLFAMLFGMLVAVASPELSQWVVEAGDFWVGMVVILAFVPLEALLLSQSGATPGKRLFSLRVVHRDGSLLRYSTALTRSWRVYFFGQGAGVPIVSWVTRALSYQRFVERGSTFWDDSCGTEVRAQELSQGRKFAAAALFGLYVALLYLAATKALA